MKKLYLLMLTIVFLSISCKKEKSNELGGDTNIPLNEVGNTFSAGGRINGEYIEVDASMEITRNDNGVVTVRAVADLTKIAALSRINDLIPDLYKDAEGKLNAETKFKVTSEGIQDYMNADESPLTLCKYSAKVGDTYSLKKSDGKTITRTVTARSDQDDFPYGFMYIKTITVEQDSRIPGIKKIVYRLNHKFGVVYAEAVAEDGTVIGMYVYPQNY